MISLVQCKNCASFDRDLSRCPEKGEHVSAGRKRQCSLFGFAKVIKQRGRLPTIKGFWQNLLKGEEEKKQKRRRIEL